MARILEHLRDVGSEIATKTVDDGLPARRLRCALVLARLLVLLW